jgi:signal transduction histidine kinase
MQERFERAEAGAAVGSYEFNLVTGERHWSRQMYRLFKRDPALGPILPEEFIALAHPSDRARLVKAMRATMTEGMPFEMEYQVQFPDGESRYFLSLANVTKSPEGCPLLISGLVKDITDRKLTQIALVKSEARLRESEERFERAEAASGVGSFEFNLVAGVTHWSRELYRLWKRDPALGPFQTEDWLAHIHPADRKRAAAASKAMTEKGIGFDEVYRVEFPDGERRHFHTALKVKLDDLGRPLSASGTTRDVTERQELEAAALRAAEEERQRLSRELHDGLGQKLTGMSLLLEQLNKDSEANASMGQDVTAQLTELIRESVDTLRDIARGVQPVPEHPTSLMTSLQRLVSETIVPQQVECLFRCPRPVFVQDQTVANTLFRIAQEALSNALLHGRPRLVLVTLLKVNDEICLEVLDDGKGIPKKQRANVGLGLKTMRSRAQAIGGSIAVQRLSPKGTLVRVTVADQATLDADDASQSATAGS